MQVNIDDDFDLDKIIESGQCFRSKRLHDGQYRFMTRNHVLYIQKEDDGKYLVSCEKDEWNHIWESYFDLDRSYRDIIATESGKHPFVDKAITYGRGLRVLRQDPWEMLVTFIISQRKSIPAISNSVEALSEQYGHPIVTEIESLKSFPSAREMEYATEKELSDCGLGYRTKYVADAIKRVNSGILNLEKLADAPDNLLLEEFQKVYGIGKKVANCICLFAYGRTACVPVDVWILRAIENDCGGISPFSLYGNRAGIIQQYVFYYERRHQP